MSTQLAVWDNARQAIAEARTIDELKDIRDKAEALRAYAKQVGETLEVQNDLAEIKLRAERRAGQISKEIEPQQGARTDLPTSSQPVTKLEQLEDAGISKMQASRWEKIADIPEPLFERHIAEVKNSDDEELTQAGILNFAKSLNNTYAMTSSQSNEWYTPSQYVDRARELMGDIDVDPASNHDANIIIHAETYYTIDDDGLEHEWPGRVWLNPPYGTGLAGAFIAALLDQYDAGIVTEAVVLLNSHITETQWFAPLWNYVLCFTDHRINFVSPSGPGNGSTHGSVFVYVGLQEERFAELFKEFGPVVRRIA